MNHFSSFGILLKQGNEEDDSPTPTNTFVDEELPVPHRAAAKGDVGRLSSAIKQNASLIEMRSHEGLTPLAQAVQCQQLKSVKQLIMMGADIDAQDNIGRTCLSVAAYQGWHEGVVCLLHHGSKRNICDNAGRSPIHAATYHSDTNTLSILLNSLSLNEINQPDNEMMTAVHWAAFHDRPEHLMQLIQKKANVFARDIDGKLPLHWAAQNGSFQCVHRLTSLPEGLASVNDLDQSGKSPAHYAAAAGSANILTILSHCDNIDLEIEDPDERTPLHWAAAMGHTKAAETLLKLGVNPFVTDVDGYTPLEYARQAENQDCLKMMESYFNKRCDSLTYKGLTASGKSSALAAEERYRYRRTDHTPDAHAHPSTQPMHCTVDLPNIKILPPTTNQTMTKTTTNKTCAMTSKSDQDPPRMYSASTDTDNLEYTAHRPNHKNNNRYHNQHHHNHHQQHSQHHQQQQQHQRPQNDANQQQIFSVGDHSNIFSKLIGSSFLAGAQAPILSAENTGGEDVAETFSPRDLAALQQPDIDLDIWAQRSGQRPPSNKQKEPMELKMMTSQNTPDLNRVSVRSFRSIPPTAIAPTKEESPRQPKQISHCDAPRPHSSSRRTTVTNLEVKLVRIERQNFMSDVKSSLAVKGLNLTSVQSPRQNYPSDYGNKTTDFQLPPVNAGYNDLKSPRMNTAWRGGHKPTAPAKVKQFVTSQPPPHDFMTDNNAETRILTRMLKSTLGKVNHKPPSHFRALHGGVDIESNKRTSGHPSIAAVLQQKRARDEKSFEAVAAHTKHSRIPSTSLGAIINKNNQQNRAQQTSLQQSNNFKSTFARSPSGMLLTDREKYLDEDVTKPVQPRPLLSVHLPNSGRGRVGEKAVDLPTVHHKSNGKYKHSSTAALKSKHGLEKLSSRYGGGGGGGGVVGDGGGGVSGIVDGHRPNGVKSDSHAGGQNTIKMPPIHKESVQKNLRRVRMDKKVQQVAFS